MNKKILNKYIWNSFAIFTGVVLIYCLFSGVFGSKVRDFLESIECKTFDLRQKIVAQTKSRKPDSNIVILAIDESTFENTVETYGEWPMPRYIYADVVEYIEKQNPKLIAFDLMFVKNIKDKYNSDSRMEEIFKKYNNLYTAINFDNMAEELRTPLKVDDKLAINLYNKANVEIFEFSNYRPIVKEISDNTKNIGHINIKRANDGVIRDVWPFIKYQNKFYPHLALLVAQNKLNSNTKDFVITKDSSLTFDNKSVPLTKNGDAIINWYNYDEANNTIFEHIPFWKVTKSIENEKRGQRSLLEKDAFKDKIVYVGVTATALNDLKTVPVLTRIPGVELHAAFINNMLDNSFIHRLSFYWDFIITLMLCLFVGLSMLRIEYSKINYKYKIPVNSGILLGGLALFYLTAFLIMQKPFYLWISMTMPTIGLVTTFTMVYVIRYFFKSKDYEYTYRLATTDGLTELYNHRYFQEQMIAFVENCKTSNKQFSLILTDIDFFKKFNDQYGHQAGDAVLRQVARTLKKHVKKGDYVCRYGGEEMSVILKNVGKQKATEIAQRLCNAVASNVCKLNDEVEAKVTISLGVSTYPENGQNPTELIEYADKGLYAAKENGRNQVGVVKD